MNHLFSGPNFLFWGDCFSQYNFKIFHRRLTMLVDIITKLPSIKRLPTGHRDMHKFLCFAYLCRSSSLLFLKYFFLRFDFFIISLLRILFVIKAVLFVKYFFFGELTYLGCRVFLKILKTIPSSFLLIP